MVFSPYTQLGVYCLNIAIKKPNHQDIQVHLMTLLSCGLLLSGIHQAHVIIEDTDCCPQQEVMRASISLHTSTMLNISLNFYSMWVSACNGIDGTGNPLPYPAQPLYSTSSGENEVYLKSSGCKIWSYGNSMVQRKSLLCLLGSHDISFPLLSLYPSLWWVIHNIVYRFTPAN